MKKVCILMLLVFISLAGVNEIKAQNRIEPAKSSNSLKPKNSVNAQKKVDNDTWSSQPEEALNKKKEQEPAQKKTVETIIIKEVVKEVEKEEKVVKTPSIEISNPCSEDITVELVSLQGNRASQKVSITIAFTNHQINKTVYIRDFNAYNEEGDHFSTWSIGSFSTLTDIRQKTDWEVGQMLPSKNSKLTAISFKIDGCTIEMRNLPIDWK